MTKFETSISENGERVTILIQGEDFGHEVSFDRPTDIKGWSTAFSVISKLLDPDYPPEIELPDFLKDRDD